MVGVFTLCKQHPSNCGVSVKTFSQKVVEPGTMTRLSRICWSNQRAVLYSLVWVTQLHFRRRCPHILQLQSPSQFDCHLFRRPLDAGLEDHRIKSRLRFPRSEEHTSEL